VVKYRGNVTLWKRHLKVFEKSLNLPPELWPPRKNVWTHYPSFISLDCCWSCRQVLSATLSYFYWPKIPGLSRTVKTYFRTFSETINV